MKVSELMSRPVWTVGAGQTVREAAQAMREHDVGALPVVEGGRVVGMITDRDVAVRVAADARDPAATRVCDVMSTGALICYSDDELPAAVQLMRSHHVRRVVVQDRDEQTVGILSVDDLSMYLSGGELNGIVEPFLPPPWM